MRIFLLGLLLAAAAYALEPGESSPLFRLPRYGDHPEFQLQSVLGDGPVLLWFTAVTRETADHLGALVQIIDEHEVPLVVVPIGPGGAELAEQFPDVPVLRDDGGGLCLQFTGEFIAGVSPRRNLFLLGPNGAVQQVRFYPGVPRKVLESWFPPR